jgi:hypothetical protein
MNDREVEQVLGSRRGVERRAHFEFIGQYSRKGSGVLNEQVFVTLSDHVAHAEVQCGQENQVHRDHAPGDEIGKF